MTRPYMTTNFKNLSNLIGREIKIVKGWKTFEHEPEHVKIIKDYPLTILIELTFIKSEYAAYMPPRKYKKMLPKAALACGDILLKDLSTDIFLVGEEVTKYNYSATPVKLNSIKIWE